MNQCSPWTPGTTISILVGGVDVTGRVIYVGPQHIRVILTAPFTSPVYLPLSFNFLCIAGPMPPEHLFAVMGPEGHHVLTPCGLKEAEDLLRILYDVACICHLHGAEIVAEYTKIQRELHDEAIKGGAIEKEEFYERRRLLRIELREGRMDPHAYQKELERHKALHERLETAAYSGMCRFEKVLESRYGKSAHPRFLIEFAMGTVAPGEATLGVS